MVNDPDLLREKESDFLRNPACRFIGIIKSYGIDPVMRIRGALTLVKFAGFRDFPAA